MHNVTHLMDLCSERVRHMQLIVIFKRAIVHCNSIQNFKDFYGGSGGRNPGDVEEAIHYLLLPISAFLPPLPQAPKLQNIQICIFPRHGQLKKCTK